MKRDPKYDVLFEPVRIGPKTMRNRFYQTPHCSGFGSDYAGTQAEFRGMKAEGGWAMVNTEYCSIHPESDDLPSIQARIWDATDVQNLSLMCDRAHDHGSLAGIELHFGGSNHSGYETRLPARGVSQIPSPRFVMRSCYEMDKRDIRELQGHYVAAAKRARDVGFDIVLVYGAEYGPDHSALPDGEVQPSHRRVRRFVREPRPLLPARCSSWSARRSATTARSPCASAWTRSTTDGWGSVAAEEAYAFIELVDHLVDLWDVQVGPPSLLDTTESARVLARRSSRTTRSHGSSRSARTPRSRSSASAGSRTPT